MPESQKSALEDAWKSKSIRYLSPNVYPSLYGAALCSGENLYETGPGPRSHISGALQDLAPSEIELKHAAGNSFHLAMFGTWAAYVLSHIKRHPKGVVLPVMRTEFGTMNSSSDLLMEDVQKDQPEEQPP